MAAVPFATQALVGTISDIVMATVGTHPVTLKEMIEDFLGQLPEVKDMIKNVMQSGASTFVLHCSTSRHAEALLHTGLTFRSHPVKLVPAPNTQWIKLTRVVYGTTENAIKSRLAEYGTVLKIRQELIHGIGISVYSVKMEIKKPIPSRITLAHYPVNVFYRGQVQQCFRCEQTGHLSKSCPLKKSVAPPAARIICAPVITLADISDVVPTTVSTTVVPPVVRPPAMSVSVPEEAASLSSTSTPVNPETGKRQRKPDDETVAPSKKDKPAVTDPDSPADPAVVVSSYVHYEREALRLAVLGSQAPPAEVAAFEGLRDALPLAVRRVFAATVSYRHPLLLNSRTKLVNYIPDLVKFTLPPSCLDLSSSCLGGPSCSSSEFPYSQYEVFRTFLECRNRFPDLGDIPQPGHDALKNLPEDTLLAYFDFYAVTHPESLADVPEARRAEIRTAYITRKLDIL